MKKGQRKYVPMHINAEKVAKQLKEMKEKYSRVAVERGITDYLYAEEMDEKRMVEQELMRREPWMKEKY